MSALVVALGHAWLLGALFVSALWPRTRSIRGDLSLVLALGIGTGLALTSVTFFVASLVTGRPFAISIALELVLMAGFIVVVVRTRRDVTAPAATSGVRHALAGVVLLQLAVIAAVVVGRVNAAEPYGGWDGWAIWNLHARLIARGGEAWPALLGAPQLAWSHLDYPLLVSASVARAWAWAGSETPFASAAVSVIFGVATAGTLVGGLIALGLRGIAFIAGILLLGTPFFVTLAANQHADVPLGGFLLSTFVLLALAGRMGQAGASLALLAGTMAGFAAWTKNEGLLLVAIIAVVVGGAYLVHGLRRNGVALLAGLLVASIPVFYFKMRLAPAGDVLGAGLADRIGAVLDPERHGAILRALGRDALWFGEWPFAPFGLMALAVIGRGARGFTRSDVLLVLALLLVAAGYYAVYLITPWDLAWHLDTSLVRLLLQLWPAAIFLWALAVPGVGDEAIARPSRRPFAIGLAASLVLAAGMLALLSRQRAPHELAVARMPSANVSVVAGDGWFPREDDRDHAWHWSRGTSALVIHVESPAGRVAPLTLTFGLRALGACTVTVRQGRELLWEGRVGEALQPVEIPHLKLAAGASTLTFSTDAPGVRESGTADARALTFALYDLAITR